MPWYPDAQTEDESHKDHYIVKNTIHQIMPVTCTYMQSIQKSVCCMSEHKYTRGM